MKRGKNADVSYEQFQTYCFNDCPDIQVPLADRVVFQMDQAKSEDQVISWNQQERCNDSNLGCHVLLSVADLHQVPDKIWLFVVVTQSGH